jgi:methyltransferase (TIGR00027 family)
LRAAEQALRNAVLVGGAKRSRTAQGVAAERALLTTMGVLDDPFAREILTPSMKLIVWALEHGPHRVQARSVTLAGLAARVRWFDTQIVKAIDAGIKQVAVIGAGYDSRAWRIWSGGVQFFELDHAATQQDKIRRAPQPGPAYVESDLTTEDAANSLLNNGFDASQPGLFVVEGVAMYLGEEVVRRQLQLLARMGTIESRLAIDFYPPSNVGTSQDHRQLRLQCLARRGSGESLHLALDCPQAVELVQESGWDVDEAITMRDAARKFVKRESGLPIDAVSEHKTLVAAVRST